MPGLIDILRPQSSNLGSVADPATAMGPDILRAELAKHLQMRGQQMDLSTMPPEQMMLLLRTLRQPTSTTGIRG